MTLQETCAVCTWAAKRFRACSIDMERIENLGSSVPVVAKGCQSVRVRKVLLRNSERLL